ncbi:acyltransferase [Agromyces sp. LHK192]|uniref:acyltransferase family protein n=1 Tax=Agromyces sp. LHK192 TaxID=2498704 RepID=UPI000FDC77B1|nr:acyltransferase [Agromyces sp. LHK192]
MTQQNRTDPRAAKLARRDLVVDLARVWCILLVVVVHLLMIGVGLDASGAVVVSRPLEAQPWFAAATWFGQVMPLFFALGGFTAITAWKSLRKRGGDAWDFVRGRTLRLAAPALPLFVFFTLAIGGATLAGVDRELVDTVATGAGTPLWFLAAYLLAQSLTPVLAHLHERSRWLTLAGLALGAVAVDAARIVTGIDEIGLVNLVFVWAFVQQLGFWYADGWFRRRTAPQLVAIAAVAYLLVWLVVDAGWYSPDMLVNLNPPTVPLALLGIAQIALLTLVAQPLMALMRVRAMQAIVFTVGSRAMTIYLWHLPVIIAVAGLTLLIPSAAPEPASPAWWWSRPVVFVAVLAAVWAISLPLARFEQVSVAIPEGRRRPSAGAVVAAAAAAFVPAFLVLQFGLDLVLAFVGVVLFAAALALDRARAARTAA